MIGSVLVTAKEFCNILKWVVCLDDFFSVLREFPEKFVLSLQPAIGYFSQNRKIVTRTVDRTQVCLRLVENFWLNGKKLSDLNVKKVLKDTND